MPIIKIGNAQGFWGDDVDAPARLLAQQPDLDYLTLDYLAEVTMSILARLRDKDSRLGYARDFVEVVRSCAPVLSKRKTTIVTNAGGLNPAACGLAVQNALKESGAGGLMISIVEGDDVLPIILAELEKNPNTERFAHLETKQLISSIASRIVTANAYIGAEPVMEALKLNPSVVVTGRVADPSLTVAPCAHHFGWKLDDHNKLAGATIAGHLIECGTQCCGGISTDWLSLDRPEAIGFPVVEVNELGEVIVTKPANTGGRVSVRTVKEQLLYEIGDPETYISPDAIVSFLGLKVEEIGKDRVRVTGARGRPTTDSYKVTATYRAGFRASSTLTIIGRDCVAKARRAGQVIHDKLKQSGAPPKHFKVECIGAGDTMPGVLPDLSNQLMETTLRVSAADEDKKIVERFAKEIIPLVTNGPQGTTGYFGGRPDVREIFGYWPCLVPRNELKLSVNRLRS